MKKQFTMYANYARLALLILLYISTYAPIYGQVREVRNAPSPEVANLGTFGSIPVGHYTGTPNISVPLYSMDVGRVSIPITAMYHTSNVKPHSLPSSLGIGWALSAGGYIARNVKGVQDEKVSIVNDKTIKAGFYYNHSKIDQIEKSSNKEKQLEEFTHLEGDDWYELAADEFSFSFNGYSGTFFMDKEGQWRVISDDNIRVEFNESDGFITIDSLKSMKRISPLHYSGAWNKIFFNKFTLVTPDGARYEFGGGNATEFSIPYYNQVKGNVMATCWRLSRITTIDGRIINFEYAADSYMCDIHYAPQEIVYNYDNKVINAQSDHGRTGFSGFLLMPSRLMKIYTDDESITFSYTRDANYGSLFLLNKLGYNNNECLYWSDENFRYMYGYNPLDVDRSYRFSNFMGLGPLESVDKTCEAIVKKITHDYLSGISVRKSGCEILNINFKFFQNGNRNLLSNILFVKDDESDVPYEVSDDMTKDKIGSGLVSLAEGEWKSDGGAVDVGDSHKNDFNKVKEYEYAFKYHLDSKADSLWPTRNPLTYTDSWGYYNSKEGANPHNRGEWGLAKKYLSSEYKIRPADINSTLGFVLDAIIYPTGGKTSFIYGQNDYSKEFNMQTCSVDEVSGVKISGGLRVESLKNYDASGNLLYSKKYVYKNALDGKSSGISKGAPCFHDRIFLKEDKSYFIDLYSFDDINPYPMNFNTPVVGYSTVFEELYDNNNQLITRTKYQYTNYDTDSKAYMDKPADVTAKVYGTYTSAPFTSMAFKRGKLISKEVMGADNKVMEKTTYDYVCSEGEPYSTVSHESHVVPIDNNFFFGFSYLYKTYANRYLVSVEKRQETMSNGTFNTEIQCQYTDYGLPRQKTVLSNSGDMHSTTYYYSTDRYPWMREKNIIVPVEIEEKEGGWVNSTISTYDKSTMGVPYVSRQDSWWNNSSLTFPPLRARTDFVVEKADGYGNPVIWKENGVRTVMIWSYKGRKLVATIQNAAYDEVKNALGVAPEDISDMEMPSKSIDELRTRLSKAFVYTYQYDNRLNLISKTEPNGLIHRYVWDSLGRLTKELRVVEGKTELLNSYKYNYSTKQ